MPGSQKAESSFLTTANAGRLDRSDELVMTLTVQELDNLNARRNLDVRQVDRLADIQLGHVDRDELR
jgi:hypothetical protein